MLGRWDCLHLCVVVQQSGSVVPAPKPEGRDRALWVNCALCRALKSHTQESHWSCLMHTLLSGLSLVWCSTLELQAQLFFAGKKSSLLLLFHSHWWSEPRAWLKPFIPERTPRNKLLEDFIPTPSLGCSRWSCREQLPPSLLRKCTHDLF